MKALCLTGLSILWLGASVALYGQEIRGLIVGNVTDSSGAAVPAIQITVKNEGTGIESRTTTDATGTYTVPDLLAGVYTVIAVKEGFKTYQATGIRLLSAQTARHDVVLQVGAVQQTVEVAARAQLVQTDSPTIGGTLQVRELADLPFITTTMDGLFNLTPGMSQGEKNGNANPAIGGAPFVGSSNFTLNGITTSNPGQGGGGNVTYVGSSEMIAQANLPAIGTMQEFKVDSSVVGADERSQTAVSVVTKQGTNKFHGTAYEYNENKALSANSFDLNATGETQDAFNRNQFGVNIGGPILKDKLFFFVNYDGLREIHPSASSGNFPSQAERNGDFSALATDGTELYNPLTGEPFAGNIIPPGMIASQSKVLNSFMPLPNYPANSPGLPYENDNWRGAIPLRYGTNNGLGRIDGQIGSKDSVMAFYSESRGLPWFYGYAGPPNYGQFSNHGYNWINMSGTETHTFGSGMINEFRLGWVFAYRSKDGQNIGFHPWDLFPGLPVSASPDGGLPYVYQDGYYGLGDQGLAKGRQDTVDWVDNFTLVHGRHTLKLGFEESGYKEYDQGGLTGAPPLGNMQSYGAWTGNAYADSLLGWLEYSSYGVNTQPYLLSREWDWYAMDTWKASPRLTVNLGLRYMYQRPWIYRDHNATFFDFANNKLILAQNSATPTLPPGADARKFAEYLPYFETTQSIGAPLNYFNGDKNNFEPRVGFAYRLSSDNKTVIRGGYGVYYAFNADWEGWRNLQSNQPWGSTDEFFSNYPATPDLTFANAFPQDLIGSLTAHPSLTVMDRNPLNPATQQWNLTLERQVGENWSFRGTYLGAASRHMITWFNGGFNVNKPLVQQHVTSTQLAYLLQPWSSINYVGNGGTSNFDQLQLEVQRRFAHGLMFRSEYDWSRHLDNANPYTTPQDPHNLAANYGNDPLQYRHRFLTYYIYELPAGRGRKWLSNSNPIVDGVLGGWQISGITTYHSGDALTPTLLRPPGSQWTGWMATWPDRVSGNLYAGRQSGHNTVGPNPDSGVQWFNPAAFAPPQPFAWGNAQPGQVWGPGFGQWDLSVMKQFRLPGGEANRLEFKMDFFNLPNHYNLDNPDMNIADTRDGHAPNPTAGKITGGAAGYFARLIQIGLRLYF